jgi:hypothetical protein
LEAFGHFDLGRRTHHGAGWSHFACGSTCKDRAFNKDQTHFAIKRRVKGVKRLLGFVLLLIVTTTPLLAVEPDEVLKDPRLEERARTLSSE